MGALLTHSLAPVHNIPIIQLSPTGALDQTATTQTSYHSLYKSGLHWKLDLPLRDILFGTWKEAKSPSYAGIWPLGT